MRGAIVLSVVLVGVLSPEIAHSQGTCNPVTDLMCDPVRPDIQLSWVNADSYDSHEIFRDSMLIATLPGDATTFIDTSPGFGSFDYIVSSTCTNMVVADATCIAGLVPPGTTHLIWNGQPSGAVDSALVIGDALGANGETFFIVDEIIGINLNCPGVWASLGIFPDNRPITQQEGNKLRQFATESPLVGGTTRSLYVEGGDVWGFDPQTPLDEVDHTTGVLDGAPMCDVFMLDGIDSSVGLDLTNFDADYRGECAFIDHLEPDTPVGSGTAFMNDGGAGQVTSVAGDGAISGIGNYRSVTSSTEFGGYDGDRTALMAEYLSFFDVGTSTEFIRADVDGDGVVSGIVDTLTLLNFGFLPGFPEPPCLAAADADGNRILNVLADALFILNSVFIPGFPPPPPPFPSCGEDANGVAALGCIASTCP